MSDGAKTLALGRMLRILNLLRLAPGGLTEEDLAARCAVLPRIARDDLRLLSEWANVPVWNDAEAEMAGDDDEPETSGRPWHLDADEYSIPPPPLTGQETWALLAALEDPASDPELETVRSQLRRALLGGKEPVPVAHLVVKGVRPAYDPQQPERLLRRLERAILMRRRLSLKYRSASHAAETERVVDPYGLVYYWVQSAWYLVGYCHQAGEARTFRLDRLRAVQELDERFPYPVDFALEEYFRHAWGVDRGPLCRVVIRFWNHFHVLERVRKEVAHRRDATLVAEPGGTLLFSDTVAGVNEIKVWVRSFGESAEVLEPEELREDLVESARRILERYGEPLDQD